MLGCCHREKEPKNKKQTPLHETEKPHYLKALQLEKEVLSFSGLQVDKEIFADNIYLDEKIRKLDSLHRVWHSKDEAPFLLIHGYGSSCTSFYRIFKGLSQKKRVYSIDLLGMNLSSRCDFNLNDPRETIKFFVNSIDKFREVLGIQKFVVIGHSFGGYIASQYTLLKKQHVQSLHLLSPLGTTKKTKKENDEFEAKLLANMGFFKGLIFQLFIKKAWENKETPSSFYSESKFLPSKIMMDGYLECRLGIKGKEKEIIKRYGHEVLSMKVSSEKGFHNLFVFPNMSAIFPLQVELSNKLDDIQVHFYYGDHNDWMERNGAKILYNKKLVHGTYEEIQGGTHNMFLDCPQYLIKKLLLNTENSISKSSQDKVKNEKCMKSDMQNYIECEGIETIDFNDNYKENLLQVYS